MSKHVILDPAAHDFNLFNSPFYLIAHADFQYHEDVEAVLVKNGVSKNIYRLLTVLREREEASISWLAQQALIKRNTVSRLVERMAQMHLVTTTLLHEDNRVTVVALTPAGRALLDRLTPVVSRQTARAMAGLGQEQLQQFVLTLRQIIDNLNKLGLE
ncbi:MarR family transcriptional regulator [Komagataeibacter xylinus]|uniref:MarR family transcriptional regulator n=1 Tax=Komagataeibacter xylinus TaxID=28448 RepID=A0A318PHK7_KOMXY|nr:MarR family winged helix-turn-helix transcriptional regulator [Komagataeibacter xylinus]AZV39830.1 MarR family transcriptional regulator [Komagataeibacter xylinus]PYD56749.1 MarR family transcriptional regulator [Komagataeibacter xylinus]GBQ74100.1 MarR family transcriptional regulator [Komagataeibacter xylinus NBRC 15237]